MKQLKKLAIMFSVMALTATVSAFAACGNNETPKTESSSTSSISSSSSASVPSADSSITNSSVETPSDFVGTLSDGHYWKDWTIEKEATCTEDGLRRLYCLEEGCEEYKEEVITAAHVWGEWTDGAQATCTQTGEKIRSCTVHGCDGKDIFTIRATGHYYDDGACINAGCNADAVYPTDDATIVYLDVLDFGKGEAYDRCQLNQGYYEVTIPTRGTDFDKGIWLSFAIYSDLVVDETSGEITSITADPGQYALYSIGGANGVTATRYDASEHYITESSKDEASSTADGNFYSVVNASTAYLDKNTDKLNWRATYHLTCATKNTTVKFRFVRIDNPRWQVEYNKIEMRPEELKGKQAPEAPANTTAITVPYSSDFFYDEWLGYYRMGTKTNSGEVIYAMLGNNAPRMMSGGAFTTIHNEGPNLHLSNGTDLTGDYIVLDYSTFIMSSAVTDNNAYENYLNSEGLYPVNQELFTFLNRYVNKNKPVDIPDDIWNNNPEKAWLAACYYYKEVKEGTQERPFVITELGNFTVTTIEYDYVYYTIKYQDPESVITTCVLKANNENAVIIVGDNEAKYGTEDVVFETNAYAGVTIAIGGKNGAAVELSFTLSLSESDGN